MKTVYIFIFLFIYIATAAPVIGAHGNNLELQTTLNLEKYVEQNIDEEINDSLGNIMPLNVLTLDEINSSHTPQLIIAKIIGEWGFKSGESFYLAYCQNHIIIILEDQKVCIKNGKPLEINNFYLFSVIPCEFNREEIFPFELGNPIPTTACFAVMDYYYRALNIHNNCIGPIIPSY